MSAPTEDELRVEFEEDPPRGRFKLLGGEGQLLGQMTFSRARADLVLIDHTEIDDSLQGMGAGSRLFNYMVEWARNTNTKVMSTCPFANGRFERDPSSRDVLLQS